LNISVEGMFLLYNGHYFLPITSASTCMNSVTLKVEAVHYCEMLDETFTV